MTRVSLAEIRRMVEAGDSITHISRATGLDWTCVRRRLDILGIEARRWTAPRWTDADDDTLRAMWTDGAVSRDIGAVLGRSKYCVRKRAEKIGLPRRRSTKGKYTAGEDAKLRALAEIGISDVTIGKRIGRCTVSVRARRKCLGIPSLWKQYNGS